MHTLKFSTEKPERLDKVVAGTLPLSRTQVQKAIKNGQILVDGQIVPVKHLITDESKVTFDDALVKPKKLTNFPPAVLDILYEDDDVIVINKPAGLLVHKTETSDEPTLVDALVAHDEKIAEVGDSRDRAGLVHRLDKGTSGVLITAKTQEAFEFLKSQFKNRETEKHYTALVVGKMEKDHDIIDFPIERSKTTGRMAARPSSQGGREAITNYDVIKRFPHQTLLDVKIDTGRTHQIRAHMYAIGHPIVGDTLYRNKGVKPMAIGRQFLHARQLTITLPSGKKKTFSAPVPRELKEVLELIPKL
ncbi:MAG: RluA family pseudouridine synthase [Patescibacteria group bacterium]|nr:RluA family pseudouridine synthase [Patescibacteria group bacterium]